MKQGKTSLVLLLVLVLCLSAAAPVFAAPIQGPSEYIAPPPIGVAEPPRFSQRPLWRSQNNPRPSQSPKTPG